MPKIWTEKIFDDPEIYILRIDDDQIKYFEAVWEIPEGISYNAYLVKLNDANVLIDGWKKNYTKEFIETLSRIVDPKEITHIIVNHTEPDHSGSLPATLEAIGHDVEIIASNFGKRLLEGFYGIKDVTVVKDGEEKEIGGKKFKFVMTPWLHWPDTMVTYLDGILFGCDVGGGYLLPETLDDSNESVVERYLPHVTKYIVTVIGHYKNYILEGAEKLSSLKIKALLPGHGLIWKKDPQRLLNHYVSVAKGEPKKGKVTVIYDSMYGFVENVMKKAIDSLKEKGFTPVVYKFSDEERPAISEILKDIPDSEALIFGVSTYEAEIHPLMRFTLLEIIDKVNYEKSVLVFGVHGWAPSVKRTAGELLKETKFRILSFTEIKGSNMDEKKIEEAISLLKKEQE
ncbi:FprA family A-type flavoprotein [Thermotoga sp. 38H-to]|uniref:FprA family A-type flavoprotein n=1 Tax=Thermotoga sp. 38H-to TaxID=1755812 RepID=UPI000408AFF3|nr:FprA family A-type flavoprotein [Thermotoga sp. 38H-to]KAF2959766.1 MBL fold metallo-hydrolase [Thermotoga sp. 38H-to]